MTTLFFFMFQLTLMLALFNIAAHYLIKRSPPLATPVCLVGITLASILIPLNLLPIPRYQVVSLPRAVTTSKQLTQVLNNVDKPFKPAADNAGDSANRVVNDKAAASGLESIFQRWPLGLHLDFVPTTAAYGSLFVLCVTVWLSLVGVCLLRLAISCVAVLRMQRKSELYENPWLQHTLHDWQGAQSASSSIRMRCSNCLLSPCVSWTDAKTIYLPIDFDQWPPEEQLTALAHELAHIVRGDARSRLCFDLITLPVMFHPLAWLLKRQLVLAQEIAADQYASHLLTADKYRKGLCRVALRMDSQPQLLFVSYGVSISTNSLVRRIKMLSTTRKPVLARWQQSLIVAIFATAGVSLALCAAGDEEPIRVASRAVSPKTAPAVYFNRGATQPWDEIGVQSGYLRFLPSEAAQIPDIKAAILEAEENLGISDLECGVKLTRDFVSCTVNLNLRIKEIPEENRNNGHRYYLNALGDKFELQFSREVDWVELADKVPLQAFAVEENVTALRKFIRAQGRSYSLETASNDSSNYGDYVVAKSLWPVVDGGVTALVLPLAEFTKIDPDYRKGELSIQTASQTVLRNCSFMGMGVDFSGGTAPIQLRLALVPNAQHTAEEIQQQVKRVITLVLEAHKTKDELSDDELQSQADWREELENCRVSTRHVDDEIGDIVLIEGTTTNAMLLIPLM